MLALVPPLFIATIVLIVVLARHNQRHEGDR